MKCNIFSSCVLFLLRVVSPCARSRYQSTMLFFCFFFFFLFLRSVRLSSVTSFCFVVDVLDLTFHVTQTRSHSNIYHYIHNAHFDDASVCVQCLLTTTMNHMELTFGGRNQIFFFYKLADSLYVKQFVRFVFKFQIFMAAV